MSFEQMWRDLQPIGRDSRTGGYVRSPFRSAERECAAWYAEQAAARGLELEFDGQDNAVAWWNAEPSESSDPQADKGILIGSHLDSVDLGGAFDGPLGVVSSFAAIDRLRDAGVRPKRPVGVAMFIEEEGSRFGVACLGSRLATGLMTPEQAHELRDTDGVALLDAMSAAGLEPKLGTSSWLERIELFVELHVEQGRDLVHRDTAVGVASASWAHGRWRFDFTGEPNHAGATAMGDRHDPMLTYAMTALAANKQARLSDTRATFGRIAVEPNITNAIPSHVSAWLDARGTDAESVQRVVDTISTQAADRANRDGTSVAVAAESFVPTVDFDPAWASKISRILGGAPVIPTGAGHDAGILQLAGIPSAMLFVRNPTGISHSPDEHAEQPDCLAGVDALTRVLTELVA